MLLKTLTFDIIGTVFDVYDGLAQNVGPLNAAFGVHVQGPAFATGSIDGYGAGVQAVLAGKGWTAPDQILLAATKANLPMTQLGAAADAAARAYVELWRALPPWPDVADGMRALHDNYQLAILSNMSLVTQTALRAASGLPFDRLLSGETVKAYKPMPAVYEMAVSSLGIRPGEILMVAAHNFDLTAAKGLGFRTAFVARPEEYGPAGDPDDKPDPAFDFNCVSFVDLAQQLGAAFVTAPEDSVAINPAAVAVEKCAGGWTLVDGDQWLFAFGASKADAERARDVVAHYRSNRICFIGRPNPPMTYLLVNGAAPTGAMAGERAIAFDPKAVVAQQSQTHWIATDGAALRLDFGPNKSEALQAVTAIRRYGFTHQCFVGQPEAAMMYFRR